MSEVGETPTEVVAQQQTQPSPEVAPQETQSQVQPQRKPSIKERVSGFINRFTGKDPTSTERADVKAVDSAGNPLQPDFTESSFTQEVRKGTAPGLDKGTGGLYPIGTIDIVDQDRARLAQFQLREMGIEARKKLAGEEKTATTLEPPTASPPIEETPATVSTEAVQPVTTPAVTEQVPEGTAEPSPAPTDAGIAKVLDTPVKGEHEEVEEFLETKPRPPLETTPPVQAEAVAPPVLPTTETGAQIPVETPQPQAKTTVPVKGAAPGKPTPVSISQAPVSVGVAEPVGKQSI